jgi:hypothetical protein
MASRARVGVAVGLGVAVLLFGVGACALLTNYSAPDRMTIPVTEFSTADYPEDPSNRSVHYGRFADRSLTLVQRDDTHFDFILEPTNAHTATVIFRNVDVSLMTPTLPAWVRGNPDLEKVALVDRQWNRQQVAFDRKSEHVEVIGGNGFERDQLFSAELAKNCLNAGLWKSCCSPRKRPEGDVLPGVVHVSVGALQTVVRASQRHSVRPTAGA